MKRDTMREYERALVKRRGNSGLARSFRPRGFAEPSAARGRTSPGGATDDTILRRYVAQPGDAARADFVEALRVLQRHNKLLLERFGVGWADVASVVEDEASRRGFSTMAMARLLAAGLRRDAEERRN